jgi:hypothetical protein
VLTLHPRTLNTGGDFHTSMQGALATTNDLHFLNASIPWPEYTSELYLPSDRRLSAKLVRTFGDKGYHVVSMTDSYCRILRFSLRILSATLPILLEQQTYSFRVNNTTKCDILVCIDTYPSCFIKCLGHIEKSFEENVWIQMGFTFCVKQRQTIFV